MNNSPKEALLTEILKVTDIHGFNDNVMPGYLYSRALYLLEDLRPLLTTEELQKLDRHGVQRGVDFIAGRPDPRGIPDKCYAVLDGSVVIIRKDVGGFIDLGLELEGGEAQEYADGENRALGVSPAQAGAMLAGATRGWGLASAYASAYTGDGTPAEPRRRLWSPRIVDQDGNAQMSIQGA